MEICNTYETEFFLTKLSIFQTLILKKALPESVFLIELTELSVAHWTG